MSDPTRGLRELVEKNAPTILACLAVSVGAITAIYSGVPPPFLGDAFWGMVLIGCCLVLMSTPRLYWPRQKRTWSPDTVHVERRFVLVAGVAYMATCSVSAIGMSLLQPRIPEMTVQLAVIVLSVTLIFGAFSWFRARHAWSV